MRAVFYLSGVVLLLGAVGRADDEETMTTINPIEDLEDLEVKEFYPEAWARINFKPMIDNERLYKKYKECYLSDHPTGCPRDVLQFRREFEKKKNFFSLYFFTGQVSFQ